MRYARAQRQRQPLAEETELRLALMRAELKAQLWQAPAIPDALIHVAIDLPDSSWQALKSAGEAPPRIQIGQRRYVLTDDLRGWLEGRPKTSLTKGRREKSSDDDDVQHQAPASAHPLLHPAAPSR